MTYRLYLPSDVEIHNVFHVSQLKLMCAPIQASSTLPHMIPIVKRTSLSILDYWMVKCYNIVVAQMLVQWQGFLQAVTTW